MPANKKHLTPAPLERILKITAGFVGGYYITEGIHILLAQYFHTGSWLFTLRYFGFILWVALLIIAFLSTKGWKIWAIYLLINLILYLSIHHRNPIFPFL